MTPKTMYPHIETLFVNLFLNQVLTKISRNMRALTTDTLKPMVTKNGTGFLAFLLREKIQLKTTLIFRASKIVTTVNTMAWIVQPAHVSIVVRLPKAHLLTVLKATS